MTINMNFQTINKPSCFLDDFDLASLCGKSGRASLSKLQSQMSLKSISNLQVNEKLNIKFEIDLRQ